LRQRGTVHRTTPARAESRVNAKVGAASISGPLKASTNPNYFEDTSSNPLILCGSHTWNTLQDWGRMVPYGHWISTPTYASSGPTDTISHFSGIRSCRDFAVCRQRRSLRPISR
jgi:hypothetical protein